MMSFWHMPGSDYPKHGITTLFHAVCKRSPVMTLDDHVLTADWILRMNGWKRGCTTLSAWAEYPTTDTSKGM